MYLSLPHLRALIPALALLAVSPVVLAHGQETIPSPASHAPPASRLTAPALASLRPALVRVNDAISGLSISHWKASKDLRASTLGDAASIQRDLNATLPPLLDQATAPGASVASSFAVYRNIDALYDVLLRISALANLAGSSSDASSLEDARASLESSRGQLGDSLLQSVTAEDTELARIRSKPTTEKPAPVVPSKVVVDDGPDTTAKHHRKRPVHSATPTQ